MLKQEILSFLSYDPSSGEFTWLKRPANRVKVGSIAGTITGEGYWRIKLREEVWAAHRLAWWIVHNEWAEEIDHINGDKLDNRIANLRSVTREQNQWNRPPLKRQARGVYFDQRRQKFGVQVRVQGVRYSGGHYDSEDAANCAAKRLCENLHGSYGFYSRPSRTQSC